MSTIPALLPNWSSTWCNYRLWSAVVVICSFLVSSCGVFAVKMNVVIFNYLPRPLADVYFNDEHVGAGFGAYGSGGTGGSISCCFSVKPGTHKIDWVLDGWVERGDKDIGKRLSAEVTLKDIKPNADYLGIYIYPDGSVALDTSKGIPDDLYRNDKEKKP
jgi:hypothetical protein